MPMDSLIPIEKVTRFEVIDDKGRSYTAYGVSVELSLQDDGRTLKAFLTKTKPVAVPSVSGTD